MAIDLEREFKPINIAVLTVSDTRTAEDDTSGDILAARVKDAGHHLAARTIIKDDASRLASKFNDWIDDPQIDAIVSTGGTGPPAAWKRRQFRRGSCTSPLRPRRRLILLSIRLPRRLRRPRSPQLPAG